jgi:TetR/AcrR family transcriptional repressor of nem operon
MVNSAKFDRQQVIANVTSLFWARGFNGCSMRDVQQAVNLRPGSLYASFGDKETLYREALLHYAAYGLAALQELEQQLGCPLAVLRQFMRQALASSLAGAPDKVCMLIKTVNELGGVQHPLAILARELLQHMANQFARLLQQAKQAGNLALATDVNALAGFYQMQLIGLKSVAQLQPQPALLDRLLQQALAILPAEKAH